MKIIKQRLIISLISLLMVLSLISQTSCEPYPKITFDNQRSQEMTIFATHVRDDGTISNFVKQGVIPADSINKINITFLGEEWVNRIEARDPNGIVVFSHDYKMADLEKIDWKIVIPK
jgi:hypothetical protein